MVQLIVGKKGKGKTKHLLEKVNNDIKSASGNIVYLDKSSKHMHELSNKVRLINVSEYNIENGDQFIGFINGIISQDYDIEQMFFDSFLRIAHLEGKDVTPIINRLKKLSETTKINFVLSISLDESELPEEVKEYIIVSV